VTWSPDPARFLADLEAKPAALRALADALDDGSPWPVPSDLRRVTLIGMGSSRFAASVVAARLRAAGIDAASELASAEIVDRGGPGTLAIGISASGGTAETVAALARHAAAGSTTAGLTNVAGSPIADAATAVVDLAAGPEEGGVACRTFQHTLVLLLALAADLGAWPGDAASLARAAADATEDLLARRDAWLPEAVDRLTASGAAYLLAPAERLSSAEQGALMLREGPRIPADACETGDWLHVDVYLTKPLDYRALVFAGSRFDADVLGWTRDRGATVVAVGGEIAGAATAVRYRGDQDPDVALVTELLVPELIAAEAWRA
jgi:glutamine---fructose-6-phosphate transaminase (isomerizing)